MKAARAGVLVAATLVVVLLGAATTVFAHAELVSSNPANGALLESSPGEILLTFTENVDPIGDSIRLIDGAGDEIDLGDVNQAGGSGTLAASIPDALDDGTYVVGWQAVSADSHRIRGAFTFSVGSESATAPGVIENVFASGSSSESESLLLGAGRVLSFGAIGVLLGALMLALVIVPELIGTIRIGRLLITAAVVAVVGTSLMIVGQAHLLSGSYSAIDSVVDTQSGRWWVGRLAAVGCFAMLVPARTLLTPRIGRGLVALSAVAVLAVVAAGGHAVSGDQVALGFAATLAHLSAMSIWIGGLALILTGVPRTWFWWTASQFSPWALGAVVVLALTGSANAWRQLGSINGVTDSSYGRWLVIKLLLVALVVIVAWFSRRLAHSDAETEPDADGPTEPDADGPTEPDADTAIVAQEAPPALRRTVMFELAGMVLILMATAGLVNSPPPLSSNATTQSASAVVGDRVMQLELEPAVTGGTEMHIYLTSPGGGLDRADEISVAAFLPEADLGPIIIATVPAGPNHVIGPDANLPVAGLWSFDVAARYGEFDQIVFSVQIPVSD